MFFSGDVTPLKSIDDLSFFLVNVFPGDVTPLKSIDELSILFNKVTSPGKTLTRKKV